MKWVENTAAAADWNHSGPILTKLTYIFTLHSSCKSVSAGLSRRSRNDCGSKTQRCLRSIYSYSLNIMADAARPSSSSSSSCISRCFARRRGGNSSVTSAFRCKRVRARWRVQGGGCRVEGGAGAIVLRPQRLCAESEACESHFKDEAIGGWIKAPSQSIGPRIART